MEMHITPTNLTHNQHPLAMYANNVLYGFTKYSISWSRTFMPANNQRSVRDRFAPRVGGARETLTMLVISCKWIGCREMRGTVTSLARVFNFLYIPFSPKKEKTHFKSLHFRTRNFPVAHRKWLQTGKHKASMVPVSHNEIREIHKPSSHQRNIENCYGGKWSHLTISKNRSWQDINRLVYAWSNS